MMNIPQVISAVLLLSVVLGVDRKLDDAWQEWKRQHEKVYNGLDEGLRRSIWEKNLETIQDHNLKYALGRVTYTMAANKFADMDWDEFKKIYLPRVFSSGSRKRSLKSTSTPVPESIDWRSVKNVVSDVKDQGQCGSCWAFTATGSMEGQYGLTYKQPVQLSEQQLVDCSGSYGNEGCNGGLTDQAFMYFEYYGAETEQAYPYKAENDPCQYNSHKSVAMITDYTDVEQGSEMDLKAKVGTLGPVAVAIDAEDNFQLYAGGVFETDDCSSEKLNHGVLAVGYGTEKGKDFWIVKNSWGPDWGENGYIRMRRNFNNMCGIATQASIPTVTRT